MLKPGRIWAGLGTSAELFLPLNVESILEEPLPRFSAYIYSLITRGFIQIAVVNLEQVSN